MDFFNRTIESIKWPIYNFHIFSYNKRNLYIHRKFGKFVYFPQHSINFRRSHRNRISSFCQTQKRNNTWYILYHMWNLTHKISLYHKISWIIRSFFKDFFSIFHLCHFFRRNYYLSNKRFIP